MKLLTTNLTTAQAQILFYFQLFHFAGVPHNLEVKNVNLNSECEDFEIGGLIITRGEDNPELWQAGWMEMTSSGNYYNPPDYDFHIIYEQKPGESLMCFVVETIKASIEESCININCNEAEAIYYYQAKQEYGDDWVIPF